MKEITATFSQQFIEVLDAICAKIGVAIDWTAENCLPQVMMVLERYRTYKIIRHSIIIALGIILIISGAIFLIKVIKHRVRESGFFFDKDYYRLSDEAYPVLILSISAIIIGLVLTIDNLGTLLEWSIVPEIQYLNLIKRL